jgi:DNA-binding response OmpR family regulator
LVALGNVLILARDEVVAALLGLMVELRGFRPRFLGERETPEDALARDPYHAVIIDCDHPGCSDEIIAAIRAADAQPILFSPLRLQSELRDLAGRYRAGSFTLPTDPDTFGAVLGA